MNLTIILSFPNAGCLVQPMFSTLQFHLSTFEVTRPCRPWHVAATANTGSRPSIIPCLFDPWHWVCTSLGIFLAWERVVQSVFRGCFHFPFVWHCGNGCNSRGPVGPHVMCTENFVVTNQPSMIIPRIQLIFVNRCLCYPQISQIIIIYIYMSKLQRRHTTSLEI